MLGCVERELKFRDTSEIRNTVLFVAIALIPGVRACRVAGGSSGFSGELMDWRNILPGRRYLGDVSSKVVRCNFLGRLLCFSLIYGA